jgi:hypothetical protein
LCKPSITHKFAITNETSQKLESTDLKDDITKEFQVHMYIGEDEKDMLTIQGTLVDVLEAKRVVLFSLDEFEK